MQKYRPQCGTDRQTSVRDEIQSLRFCSDHETSTAIETIPMQSWLAENMDMTRGGSF